MPRSSIPLTSDSLRCSATLGRVAVSGKTANPWSGVVRISGRYQRLEEAMWTLSSIFE